MKVLVTGATGLVGKKLGVALVQKGHEVIVVSRSRSSAERQLPFPCTVMEADLMQGPIAGPLSDIDAVVNLLGEPVAQSWRGNAKEKILNSRVKGTAHLRQSFSKEPKVWINASAIGYYGHRKDEVVDEAALAGRGFLSEVCKQWEAETAELKTARVVLARIGIVLASQGGALDKMLLPFRLGLGGEIGDGKAWMSWIHIDDLVAALVFALEDDRVRGALNLTSPHTERNRGFSEALSHALGKSLGPKVPEMALKLLYGEMAEVVLASTRVNPKKLHDLGFQYRFARLSEALEDLLKDLRGHQEIFESEQWFPQQPEELFPFFADAKNLEKITPETLNFKIKEVSTSNIEEGTLIDYRLKIHGVPVGWRTRIESWNPPRVFVDTQLKGPYKVWHHSHSFEKLGTGTLMRDRVKFQLPLGFMGWLGGFKLVRMDVEKIFSHRREVLHRLFR